MSVRRKRLSVLGSTGSIGTQTLDIVDQFPDLFEIAALSAGKNINRLRTQIERYKPQLVCTEERGASIELAAQFPDLRFVYGEEGLEEMATLPDVDVFVIGIVGFAALRPTLKAAAMGKTIALANKEVLVVAGPFLNAEASRVGTHCIPIDSEHNALYQLLLGRNRSDVRSLVLTASGGPLLRKPDLPLEDVTPAIAINHPNWKMGPKISVDSATLMNKGLELIEAHFLFNFPPDQIEIWIHPQSIVHGALWLSDNTCLAQLSKPNMKASIGHAMGYPERLAEVIPKLNIRDFSNLEFYEPDEHRFPALRIAREALTAGSSHLIVLNAGNEIAVQAFLDGKILFSQISSFLDELLGSHQGCRVSQLDDIYAIDEDCRQIARRLVKAFEN
jgi:1-deoxy-D-xylulose-5-phosphate reductoisomerase